MAKKCGRRRTKGYAGTGVHADTRSAIPGESGNTSGEGAGNVYRAWDHRGKTIPGVTMSQIFA